jgi:hypothetical protein
MKRKDVLSILIPSFIFVVAWIVLSIHHNVASSTISEAVNMQIAPISATFDESAITVLKKRQSIVPNYEMNIPIQNIVIPATPSAIENFILIPTTNKPAISSGSANLGTPGGSLSQ